MHARLAEYRSVQPSTSCQSVPCFANQRHHAFRRTHTTSPLTIASRATAPRTFFTGATQLSAVTRTNGAKWVASQWLENSAEADVPVPLEECWRLWEDRELIPSWMPWISSVKVQPDDTTLSRWTLSTYQFNRQWEFSWIAKNLTPIKYQKLHWRSVDGSVSGSIGSAVEVPNRGQIRFYRKSPTTCSVKLTISYQVPDALAPFANLLTPLVEGILSTDMRRFCEYAKQQTANAKTQ